MKRTNGKQKKWFLLTGALALCAIFATARFYFLYERKEPRPVWYVEKGLEDDWARVLRQVKPPEPFDEIRLWDGEAIPEGKGILIATKPWQNQEKVTVYHRLSYDLEYEGALVLAVNPWMIFSKYTDPMLTAKRVFSTAAGKSDGVLLIPGKDPESVRAWTARFMQTGPGAFSSQEINPFDTYLFPHGAQTYNWQDVFYRLMGSETAWVYAPLSEIRRYPNFRKSILAASPFPEPNTNQYSIQATLLWAVPLGSPQEQKKIAQTIAWLKKPETQTVIADSLEWIPADPYGKPYDPVSLTSHRNWLTASYVFEVNAFTSWRNE